VYRLEGLFSLARDERIEPVLVGGSAAASTGAAAPDLDSDALRFVRDFVMYRLLEEERSRLSATQLHQYVQLLDSLSGRDVFVGVPREVTVLRPGEDSSWVVCREAQKSLSVSPHDVDQSGNTSPVLVPSPPMGEVAEVLREGGRALTEWAKTNLARASSPSGDGNAVLHRVLVIGAYGGEHIGDAAILGGVLLRIHRRHGTREAILVSQRPDHTAHLVPMLDTPVRVRVEEYSQSTTAALLEQVDGVVFAGGPLMDLPKQLVKHLHAVALARRAGKPFIVEGIGAGPFVRWPSAWTARRLVRMADRISMRTSDDSRAPLVRGLRVEAGRDPAFDYLETRRGDLSRLPEIDRLWIERLLKDTEGRTVVGINLRPIRPDYTTDTAVSKRVAYTRFVEARFEERLTEAMRQFHKSAGRPPCFVFFPMNAIQFGLSDLRSAYRLRRLLRRDVDFRVWEGDASIDGVVALLRRLDIAITMRFHATIYALVQGLNVIGIDYRVGRRDKVAALLTDFGRSDDCARIDEMTTDWLHQRLSRMSS
jgi:polysaccharide pyruvyl transferase WcaK-like protein